MEINHRRKLFARESRGNGNKSPLGATENQAFVTATRENPLGIMERLWDYDSEPTAPLDFRLLLVVINWRLSRFNVWKCAL